MEHPLGHSNFWVPCGSKRRKITVKTWLVDNFPQVFVGLVRRWPTIILVWFWVWLPILWVPLRVTITTCWRFSMFQCLRMNYNPFDLVPGFIFTFGFANYLGIVCERYTVCSPSILVWTNFLLLKNQFTVCLKLVPNLFKVRWTCFARPLDFLSCGIESK